MGYLKQLTRRKNLSETINEDSQLGKVLNTVDLTAIGVGCTLGVGIYVLPGAVAKYVAGPGVIYSFFWAALTSILAGLCFAEFGARVPKAGSAYTYSYVTIGEFVAFIIGWNLIMEYVIGTASVAKGLSVYIDSMLGGKMEAFYRQLFEMKDALFLSDYIDIFAFVISMVITTGLAVGLKESMTLNNFLTFINVSVIIFVVVAGSFKGDWSNWSIPASEVPAWAGTGGFLPYGLIGTVAGAATCFFGYVGFDSISASGEEVKNPQKAIPLSIILSITIVFFAYFGVSAVLTLMWPYYLQDPDAPLPYVFDQVGWPWAKWIVAVGGIFGLVASLIAGMFPLPRIVYAMANDGLLFKRLGHVHQKFKTPVFGTFVAGFITGVMAAAFKLKQLVDLMSIATLLAYTIVAACVLLLRYREETETSGPVTHEYVEQTPLVPKELRITCKAVLFQMFNRSSCSPTRISSAVVVVQTILFCIYSTCLAFMTVYLQPYLLEGDSRVSIGCSIFVAFMFTSVISISCQPPSRQTLSFKVPLVPLIPCLSIFLNIYLMVLMDGPTWIRFVMWLAVGLLIYFSYGIYHSSERRKDQYVEYKTLITTDEETTA